jgi:hypothetical protein
MTHWLGKVFGVLTIIATMVLIALTVMVFHTHASWKMAVKNPQPIPRFNQLGLEPELARREAMFAQLRGEKDQQLEMLAVERGAARERMSDLETQIAQLEDEFAQREDELAKMTANHVKNEEVLATSRTTFDALAAETREAYERLRTTQLDANAQFDRAVLTANEIAKSEELRRETTVGAGGVRELGTLAHNQKAVMDKLDVSVYTNIDGPAPRLTGVVNDVSNGALLEISRGSDDGLQIGHTLQVYRGSRYLGRVIVRQVYPDRSVAEVMKDFRRGPIQRGDRVTTRFN